jgi:PAS domain S-box-containing protein/putative nucleotidyltransferase with HDIG domain
VILVAYERESEQNTLEQLLSSHGHNIVRSSNGLAALETARRDPPHLVISDIVLPRMDGFALCRKWKQDERLQAVPFVFYTRRHDDPKYERFALELGAERFLARSSSTDELLRAVSELLQHAPKTETVPMLVLDERAAQRGLAAAQTQPLQADERVTAQLQATVQAHQQSLERAQQSQVRLRSELAELDATNHRLAAGEARFRRLFEANPLPMWIEDHATPHFIAVNEASLALYGYTRAQFLALKVSDLVHSPGEEDGLIRHKRSDGGALLVELASQQIEFDGRQATLFCIHDMSARHRVQQSLQQQAQEKTSGREVIDQLADGYWRLAPDGRILDVNPTYCALSGYGRDALLQMNVSDIEQHGSSAATIRMKLERSQAGQRYEARHKRPDGSLLEVEVSISELDSGERVALIREIGQRRRQQVEQRLGQRQLEFLIDLFRQADSFDESAIVRRVLERAAEITSSPLAYLFFADPAQQTLTLGAWRDETHTHTHVAAAKPLPLQGLATFGDCVQNRQAVCSNEHATKTQIEGLPEIGRYLAVPVRTDEHTAAMLGVGNRDADYDSFDQQALVSMAEGAWRVLQSKRAHAVTLGSLQRAEIATLGLVEAVVRLGERHDPYTAGSAHRVAALAVALAREFGLEGPQQQILRLAALLHDIGNIAVPAALLAKPGVFTETETALMRTHVEEGAKLLADLDMGMPVAEIVREHHERFDGSGYPRGLQGEQIMLEARVLAIADCVEAMCSARPYRAASGMDAALEELQRNAGRLYDGPLVSACVALVRRGFVLPG